MKRISCLLGFHDFNLLVQRYAENWIIAKMTCSKCNKALTSVPVYWGENDSESVSPISMKAA